VEISPSIPDDMFCPGSVKYNLYRLASGALPEAAKTFDSSNVSYSNEAPRGRSKTKTMVTAVQGIRFARQDSPILTNVRRIRDVKEFGRLEHTMHQLLHVFFRSVEIESRARSTRRGTRAGQRGRT
jgi:hypothetical protein